MSVGLKTSYDFTSEYGTITPALNVRYTHNYNGNINQRLHYLDNPNNSYNLSAISVPIDMGSFDVGIGYRNIKGLALNISYLGSFGSTNFQNNALKLAVNIGW